MIRVLIFILLSITIFYISQVNLIDYIKNKKVLVIGNSPNTNKHVFGDAIDNSDYFIIRFNKCCSDKTSKMYHKYVGSRKDCLVLNVETAPYAATDCLNIYCYKKMSDIIFFPWMLLFNIHVVNMCYGFTSKLPSSGISVLNYLIQNGITPVVHGFTINQEDAHMDGKHLFEPEYNELAELHDFDEERVILNKWLNEKKITTLYNELL